MYQKDNLAVNCRLHHYLFFYSKFTKIILLFFYSQVVYIFNLQIKSFQSSRNHIYVTSSRWDWKPNRTPIEVIFSGSPKMIVNFLWTCWRDKTLSNIRKLFFIEPLPANSWYTYVEFPSKKQVKVNMFLFWFACFEPQV